MNDVLVLLAVLRTFVDIKHYHPCCDYNFCDGFCDSDGSAYTRFSKTKLIAHELFHSQSSQGSLHSHRSHSQGTGGWPGQQHPTREAEQPGDVL